MGRETIIKQTREALRQKNEIATAEAYAEERERQQALSRGEGQDLAVEFARQWLTRGGGMSYCTDEVELSRELEKHGPVMLCEALLRDSGAILLSDREGNRTDLAHLPEQKAVAAFTSQVAADWEEALTRLREGGLPRNLLPLQPDKNVHLILIEDL